MSKNNSCEKKKEKKLVITSPRKYVEVHFRQKKKNKCVRVLITIPTDCPCLFLPTRTLFFFFFVQKIFDIINIKYSLLLQKKKIKKQSAVYGAPRDIRILFEPLPVAIKGNPIKCSCAATAPPLNVYYVCTSVSVRDNG
jgi:hypothetical protein